MMKRNRLTALLALALVLVMIFTSCDSPMNGASSSSGEGSDDVGGMFTTKAAEWAEYLYYDAPEATPVYKAEKILADIALTGAVPELIGNVIVTKEFVETIETLPAANSEDEPTEILISTTVTEKWYSAEDGKLLQTFVSLIPEITHDPDTGLPVIDESIDIENIVEYDVKYDFLGKFFAASKATYVLKDIEEGEEPLDPSVFANYKTNYVDNIYFTDGTLFLENLDNPPTVRDVANQSAMDAGYYLVDCEELDKTYLISADDEIVHEFAYGEEYNIPVYDEEKSTKDGGYAYFEVGENKYLITEQNRQDVPISAQMALVRFPGMTLRVTDKDNKTLAYYETSSYSVAGYAVLTNGNVYICEYDLLPNDATEYDAVFSAENKIKVYHKIISIADGSVTELDLDFLAQGLFNNVTKSINSDVNDATLLKTQNGEYLLNTAKVKDGFIIAQIQKFAEGKLDSASSYVVLNDNLEIVKELTAIIPNQFAYPSFMDENNLVVPTRTVGHHIVYYSINVSDNKTSLAPELSALQNVEILENGYFYGNKVYDMNWRVVKDFSTDEGISDFRVINKTLYYSKNSEYDATKVICRGEITRNEYGGSNEYVFASHDIASNAEFVCDGIIKGVSDEKVCYYNIARIDDYSTDNVIFRESEEYEYFYVDNAYGSIQYLVKKTIADLVELENGYLLVIECNAERLTGNSAEETGMPDNILTYEYYIIK